MARTQRPSVGSLNGVGWIGSWLAAVVTPNQEQAAIALEIPVYDRFQHDARCCSDKEKFGIEQRLSPCPVSFQHLSGCRISSGGCALHGHCLQGKPASSVGFEGHLELDFGIKKGVKFPTTIPRVAA